MMGQIRFDLVLGADGVLPVDQVAHVVGAFANDQHGGYWQLGMDAAFENKVWLSVGVVDITDDTAPNPAADTLPLGTRAKDQFGRIWMVGKSLRDDSIVWKGCGFDATGTPVEHLFAPKAVSEASSATSNPENCGAITGALDAPCAQTGVVVGMYYIIFDGAAGSGYKPDWRYLTPDTGSGHLHVPYFRREELALKVWENEATQIIWKLQRLGFKQKFEVIAV
jgi:hypothetical protein